MGEGGREGEGDIKSMGKEEESQSLAVLFLFALICCDIVGVWIGAVAE